MMIKQNEVIDFLKEQKPYMIRKFHVEKIGLFGSFSRNEQTDNSDIDIIIEFQAETKNIYQLKENIRLYLKNKFNRNIDIAREKYLKPYIKDEILNNTIYV